MKGVCASGAKRQRAEDTLPKPAGAGGDDSIARHAADKFLEATSTKFAQAPLRSGTDDESTPRELEVLIADLTFESLRKADVLLKLAVSHVMSICRLADHTAGRAIKQDRWSKDSVPLGPVCLRLTRKASPPALVPRGLLPPLGRGQQRPLRPPLAAEAAAG